MRKLILLSILVISLGVSIGSISAQSSYEIPSWVKGIAGFWAEDKITDSEFGEGLSFLIDSGIIEIPLIQELQNEINNLQYDNSDLREKTIDLENQNMDLRHKINQITTNIPQTDDKITSKTQTDLNYPKITKRIDGEDAGNTIVTLTEFHDSLTRTQKNELVNRNVDQSQFTIGIIYDGNWNLTFTEYSFEFKEYGGIGMSVIPFDCSHNMDYIYSIVGMKMDETGELFLYLFKNGVSIGDNSSEKPFGTVILAGVCDEPYTVN